MQHAEMVYSLGLWGEGGAEGYAEPVGHGGLFYRVSLQIGKKKRKSQRVCKSTACWGLAFVL